MNPIIELKELSFRYGKGEEALSGIDLRIREGETVVLVGPNGAGKSTLLLLLRGILDATEGEITVNGRRLEGKGKIEALAGEVGLVFQDPDDQLFSSTVFDDVAFGPINLGLDREEVNRRVKRSLAAVGLSGYEKRVPHHLSGGEKRRVSLATVYSMEPSILLLDEPTSHLDPKAHQEVIRLIEDFPGTRVIATHDFELILKVATRVVLLYKGKIAADDSPVKILTDEALLWEHGLEMPLVVRYLMALHSGDHEALHQHEHEHVYDYHVGEGRTERRIVRHIHPHEHGPDADHGHNHEGDHEKGST
jgi:cobalt/nickel transport system ATP-binding protein